MNEWSRSRRRNALLIALAFLVVVIALPLYYFFNITPTCFDTKQNGDETGVDCGGSCTLICGSQALPLIMKGDARVLEIATSTYEVVAHVQNPNPSSKIMKARYTFTLYEASSSIPVKTVAGYVYVPKNTDFAVFEGPFNLADKMPSRVTFYWDNASLVWIKDAAARPNIEIAEASITNASTSPRVDASVMSSSLEPLQNIYLTALIFDNTGTIMAASKTYIDALNPRETVPVTFTWPRGFKQAPASVTVLPVLLPDSSYIK
jgi:hypothetical protein